MRGYFERKGRRRRGCVTASMSFFVFFFFWERLMRESSQVGYSISVFGLGEGVGDRGGGVMVCGELAHHVCCCEVLHRAGFRAGVLFEAHHVRDVLNQSLQMSLASAFDASAKSAVVIPVPSFALSSSKRLRSTAILVEAKRAGYTIITSIESIFT